MFKRKSRDVYMVLTLGGDVISCITFADALENIAERSKSKATDKIRVFNEASKITGFVKFVEFYHDLSHYI